MLYKLLFCHFYRSWVISLLRKESLSILHWLLKVLEHLFIGIDEHLIIQMKFKCLLRKHSKIKSQISMIASHSIEQTYQLDSNFSKSNNSKHFLYLYFYRIGNKMLLQDSIKEDRSIFLEHCLCMSFLLIKFDSKELTQLLHCMFLVVKHIIFIYSLHVCIFIFQTSAYYLRMSFYMFSKSVVICTF